MEFERKIMKYGTSLVLVIPPDVCKFIGLEEKTDVIIKPEEGKYGKFISFWRKDQQDNADNC